MNNTGITPFFPAWAGVAARHNPRELPLKGTVP